MLRVLRLLALAVVIVVAGGALVVWLAWRDLFGPARVSTALANLPRTPLAELIGPALGSADLIVFHDGADGWFMIPDPEAAAALDIGFFGPRFTDMLLGSRHSPLYCTTGDGPDSDSKIVWAVQDASLSKQLAFCNQRRMDLAALRPLGQPVTMHGATLTRAEVTELSERLAADAELQPIVLPAAFERFDHTRLITLPAHWYSWDSGVGGGRIEQHFKQQLTEHLARHDGAFEPVNWATAAPERTRYTPDGNGGFQAAETGPVIVNDGTNVLLTEINWITIPRLRVECEQAACAAIDGFAPVLFDEARDMDLLTRALASALPVPDMAIDAALTPQDLRDTTITIGPITPVTYDVRWISQQGTGG